MRQMSFALTTNQIRQKTKFVTRRLGWKNLKPGELFQAVEKGQGLKAGEKVNRLGVLRCDSNTEEQLRRMTDDRDYGLREVKLEGFPTKTPDAFVDMFCEHNKLQPTNGVRRIQFSYVIDLKGNEDLLIPGREVEWEGNDSSRFNAFISAVWMASLSVDLRDKSGGGQGNIPIHRIKRIFISAP